MRSTKKIKTEEEYKKAIDEMDKLVLSRPDTPEGDRFEELAAQVEAYERQTED